VKKQVMSFLMLSALALTAVAPLATAADDVDSQIESKNQTINSLKEKEATAQAEVDSIQSEVSKIEEKAAELKAENEKLIANSDKLAAQIDTLNDRIIKREVVIKKQARSVQTNGTSANYIDVVLDADSVSDAITRVQAVTKIVSANNDMINQQKKDKEDVLAKQKDNAEKILTVSKNQKALESDEQVLQQKQADLKVAQLSLAAERATAEGDRSKLLDEKAAAQATAKRVAEEQAQAAAKQADEAKKVQESLNNVGQAAPTPDPTPAPDGSSGGNVSTPDPTPVPPVTGGGGGNYRPDPGSYPYGQCTWYVKSYFGSRVGDFWGNGGQWGASAAADGYRVDSSPAPGTVAVFGPGVAGASGYGHVAVVVAVSGSSITIKEMNYAGISGVNTRTISAAGLQFIHV
jgi:peptidoglycan hydrolase CwlO-like protein